MDRRAWELRLAEFAERGALSWNGVAVGKALMSFRNSASGACWPCKASIAGRCGLSLSTVGRWLDVLRELGFVGWSSKLFFRLIGGRSVPRRASNDYSFSVPALAGARAAVAAVQARAVALVERVKRSAFSSRLFGGVSRVSLEDRAMAREPVLPGIPDYSGCPPVKLSSRLRELMGVVCEPCRVSKEAGGGLCPECFECERSQARRSAYAAKRSASSPAKSWRSSGLYDPWVPPVREPVSAAASTMAVPRREDE